MGALFKSYYSALDMWLLVVYFYFNKDNYKTGDRLGQEFVDLVRKSLLAQNALAYAFSKIGLLIAVTILNYRQHVQTYKYALQSMAFCINYVRHC